VDGPIREYYLVSSADTDDVGKHRTEVCWPVFRTGAALKSRTRTQRGTAAEAGRNAVVIRRADGRLSVAAVPARARPRG
jgi:hypothetical protein